MTKKGGVLGRGPKFQLPEGHAVAQGREDLLS